VISPVTAIKAIEMKHKLFNGGTGGHTIYGLEEIKVRDAAREQAIIACLMEFILQEKHEEAVRLMDHVTREYYKPIVQEIGDKYRNVGQYYASLKPTKHFCNAETIKEMKEQLIEQARKAMTIKGKLTVASFDDLEIAFVEL